MRTQWVVLAALAVLAAPPMRAAAQQRDVMLDIGTLGGGSAVPAGLNNRGQVCGTSLDQFGQQRAFLWDPVSGMQDLGTPDGYPYSAASGINDAGQVCGYCYAPDSQSRALLWDPVTGIHDIGPAEATVCYADAINASGQVCGTYYTPSWEIRAFRWDPGAGVEDLGSLGTWGATTGISASGQVCGAYLTPDWWPRAFRWTPAAGMQDLGTLGGPASMATAINGAGQVCGWSYSAGWEMRPVLWDPGTGIHDLGSLGGGWLGSATGINEAGQVCGSSANASGEWHAFVWDPAAGLQDRGTIDSLSSFASGINAAGTICGAVGFAAARWDAANSIRVLGWLGGSEAEATDINNAGQVCGRALTPTGETHTFILVPTSAPAPARTSFSFVYSDGTSVAYGVLHGTEVGLGAYAAGEGSMLVLTGPAAGAYSLQPNPVAPYRFDVPGFIVDDVLYPGRDPALDSYGLLFAGSGRLINLWGNGPGVPYSFYSYDVASDQGAFALAATAGEQVRNLTAITGLLVQAGVMGAAEARALQPKLDAAAAAIARGSLNAARGSLQAFANQMNALVQSERIDATHGQSLVDLAIAATEALDR